jgi:hypothetical protein
VAQLVEQRREGLALLGRACEVDAAQEGRLLGDGALEELAEEDASAPRHLLQGLGKEEDLGAPQRIGLPHQELGKELVQPGDHARQPGLHVLLEVHQPPLGIRPAERLPEAVRRERPHRLEEAVDPVALRDHHVDRSVHAQKVRDLVEATSQLLRHLHQGRLVAAQ